MVISGETTRSARPAADLMAPIGLALFQMPFISSYIARRVYKQWVRNARQCRKVSIKWSNRRYGEKPFPPIKPEMVLLRNTVLSAFLVIRFSGGCRHIKIIRPDYVP